MQYSSAKLSQPPANSEHSASAGNTQHSGSLAAESYDTWQLVHYYLQPLQQLFNIDGITEICVNRFDEVYIERFGAMERTAIRFGSEDMLSQAIMQIGNALGQPADPIWHPILDARLKDGSRVCGVLYPTATRGSAISIRVFPKQRLTARGLLERGSLGIRMLEYLRIAVLVKANMLISGGTASGKTTLLNVLSSFIPKSERLVTVEDTKELQIDLPNLVCLEAPQRKHDQDGAQHIDMAFLIRTTLRLNPSRLIVGEIRDLNAATSFLHAINTGHSGTCSTIHANNPLDALTRMQTLVAGGGTLPFDVVRQQVRANLDVIVQAESTTSHGRRVVEIAELHNGELSPLWNWNYASGVHQEHVGNVAKSRIVQRAQMLKLNCRLG